MFDIKDVEIVFPDVVYSVIINLPCKTTAFGAKSDTKGPSLDLWCWARKDWKRKKGAGGEKKVQRCHRTKSVNFQTVVVNFERQRKRLPEKAENWDAQSETQRKSRWGKALKEQCCYDSAR